MGHSSAPKPDSLARDDPCLDTLAGHAIAYYRDFVKPAKQYRLPDVRERAALADLAETLRGMERPASAETIQNAVYEVGKRHGFLELRAWFGCLYQVCWGKPEGPRFGSFVAFFGLAETVALIRPRSPVPPGPA